MLLLLGLESATVPELAVLLLLGLESAAVPELAVLLGGLEGRGGDDCDVGHCVWVGVESVKLKSLLSWRVSWCVWMVEKELTWWSRAWYLSVRCSRSRRRKERGVRLEPRGSKRDTIPVCKALKIAGRRGIVGKVLEVFELLCVEGLVLFMVK